MNGKAITTYLGHASVQTAFDLHGHLMPGNEEEAAAFVDAYLERTDTGSPGSEPANGWPYSSRSCPTLGGW